MCGLTAKPIAYQTSGSGPIVYRGPDSTVSEVISGYEFLFNRLAIIDTSSLGNQPFVDENFVLVCNGEIFNYKQIKASTSYHYKSHSDCEVLLPLLVNYSIEDVCHKLDGEFAFVALDKRSHKLIAARDPMGIRPLFYGYTKENQIAFASEMKALLNVCEKIIPFPPGYYYDGEKFNPYLKLYEIAGGKHTDMPHILDNIRNLLIKGVLKRLDADVPIGFLLSGGLDSSLVCAIAAKHSDQPLETFAIGLDHNPIDLKYAKQMADYLGSRHHEVIFNRDDVYATVRDIIWKTETWDITTIRASLPMYLLCKYIRNNSSIRVLLSGEISDELFGYKYTDFAPDAAEFQKESQKRIKELYMYDVLRADRCIASNSLEARVPFSDTEFIEYVMNIDPELKLNKYNMGKYLLRKAFEGYDYLPDEILWREKAAFSDAVGHGMVDYLQEMAEVKYTDKEFNEKIKAYPQNMPPSKEALMYREMFNEMFPNQEHVISAYWLPNQTWPNCNLTDPSARHLPNYGDSGK
ncbi:MAG: asparagine synthetase [Burkholderiales bacterium]|jgi:asparagine synthase (glutamine-hydrolysing)|nr:asparagine synthetase [Burkholderiales bacterium]